MDLPGPPLDAYEMHIVPQADTPGHVPAGFVQMEDHLNRAYLVPDFMAESLQAAARQNRFNQMTILQPVEV